MNKNAIQGRFWPSKRPGFTLIELLIVVLIIGVLAAVALPQYQLAVAKSRVSAMLPLVKSMAAANEMYYMENGCYAAGNDVKRLNLEVPAFCNFMSNNHWSCGTDFMIDFSNQRRIILNYCPGMDGTLSGCVNKRELVVEKYYQKSDHESNAGKWGCGGETPLGRKICNSLALH